MVPGIDPKVDYAFKRVFGTERNRPVLQSLLNAVLQRPDEIRITHLDLLNPFNEKETIDDKLSIVDVKARDQLGRQYNVEMQMLGELAFLDRALYYWSKLHQQQMHAGEEYTNLRPTISVLFINEVVFAHVTDHHLRFILSDARNGVVLSDHLEMHLFELPKFQASAQQLAGSLEKWLYFLRHAESLDSEALPPPLQVPEIRQAMGELVMVSQQELDRFRYEDRLKAERDALYAKNMARHMSEKAHAEGLKEGHKAGLAEGRKAGELIGRIHLCQRALKLPLTPEDELLKTALDELGKLADQLEQQLLAGR